MKDALGSVQSVLVLGGGSDIALATCRKLVRRRATRVVLAARKPETLEAEAAAAARRGRVGRAAHDVRRDRLLVARLLRDARRSIVSATSTSCWSRSASWATSNTPSAIPAPRSTSSQTNFTGVVSVTVPVIERLRRQGHGTIVLLSSVAAERVRRSNFVYGSSKAGADAFFQGLGDALGDSGVHAMVVRARLRPHEDDHRSHGRAAFDDSREGRGRDPARRLTNR